mgnify:CR=1 FL=1
MTRDRFEQGWETVRKINAEGAQKQWDALSAVSPDFARWIVESAYCDVLERCQKGSLNITAWIEWYLHCLKRAIAASEETLEAVLSKAGFWKTHAGESFNDRQRAIINRLLDGFEGKLTSSKWAKLAKCSQDTALRDISDLLTRRILATDDAGGSSTSYELMLGSDRP